MSVQKRVRGGRTRWVGRYRDPAGREHSKTFDTQREAKAWVVEQQRDVRRGDWTDPADARITVGEMMRRWAARPLRGNSHAVYQHLCDQLGPLEAIPVAAVTPGDVEAWIGVLQRGRPWADGAPLSETTVRQAVTSLRAAFAGLVEDGALARNPVRRGVLPRGHGARQRVRPDDIPTPGQVASLVRLAAAGGYPGQRGGEPTKRPVPPRPELALLLQVAVGTGCRLGELIGLQVGDVDFLRRVVRVRRQARRDGELVPPKTAESVRDIPVADDLLAVLSPVCGGRDGGARLLVCRDGRPWSRNRVEYALRPVAAAAGLEGLTMHRLRHYYASALIAAGVPVTGVQAALGHGSAALTLDVYTHLWPGAEDVTRRAAAGLVPDAGPVRDGAAGEVGGGGVV